MLSGTSHTSQLILQPFRQFTYVTTHSPTLPLLHLRHSSFSNSSFASCTSQALHLMNRDHSTIFPSLHLRHSSLSNPSVSLPTSQLILQPFRCFTYIAAHSPTLLSLLLRHMLFPYVTWRAAHDGYQVWLKLWLPYFEKRKRGHNILPMSTSNHG